MKLITYRCTKIMRGNGGSISTNYCHDTAESLEASLESIMQLAESASEKNENYSEEYIVINVADISQEFFDKWDGELMGT